MKKLVMVVALVMASTSASATKLGCMNRSWCGGSAPTTYAKMRAASNAMQARIDRKVLVKTVALRAWADARRKD